MGIQSVRNSAQGRLTTFLDFLLCEKCLQIIKMEITLSPIITIF